MSQSNLYGLAPYELRPGPDFQCSVDSTGKYTGSMSFACRKFDYSSTVIQSKIKRGKTVTSLYEDLGSEWNFLLVEAAKHEHQPGGITKVFIEFEGYPNGQFIWETNSTSEGSYSLNAALTERDIILHPKVQALPSLKELSALFYGTGFVKAWGTLDSSIVVVDSNDNTIGTITDADSIEWYGIIFTKGNRSYQVPTAEWTQSKTNLGGLTAGDLLNHGYIDTPSGNPPSFAGRNWLYTGVSEVRTRGGGQSTVTWAKTWQASPPGQMYNEKIYTKSE